MDEQHREENQDVAQARFLNQASDCIHQAAHQFKENIRFSIALRTSLFYGASFLRSFFFLALLLSAAYAVVRAPVYGERLESFRQGEAVPGVAMQWHAQEELPGITFYGGWGLCVETGPLTISLQYLEESPEGVQRFLLDLGEDARFLGFLLLALAVGVIFESFFIVLRGRRISRQLLSPLGEIAATAQTLSEKNLSARINLEGTQNELKDLAVVLNEMLDRLESAYNRQKQFVSDASHELRTPLAVLHGYAGMLQRWGKDSPEVRDEAIAAIVTETQGMKDLVENLLFLARHDRKTLTLSFAPFNAGEMLRESIRDTELLSTDRRIATGEIASCVITADRSSVKQAVRIFVDNALKFTLPGGTVTFSSREHDGCLDITISDTGPGIAKADLEKIFDRFYRAESARNAKVAGHGLGLSIARIIAASHGGKIHVRSILGKGSAFTLKLPLYPKI